MRAVWIEPSETFLAERRRRGQDKKDEVWDGVLHMVPPPLSHHTTVSFSLARILAVIGARRGLIARPDSDGLFEPGRDDSYRIPDGSLVRPEHLVKRGIEGAELVIEILSPHDESRDKFPFYAKLGVREIWLVEPNTLVVEVYTLAAGAYVTLPAAGSLTVSPLLGISLELDDGPRLQLRDGDDVYTV